MSGACNTAAPAGASPSAMLRRPAPALAPSAPPRAAHVTILGELAEDAHAGIEAATQRAALSVVVAQAYGMPKVLATWWLGDGVDDILEAEYQASRLQAGDAVRIEGDSLRLRYHHGAIAVTVGTVRSITPAAEPDAAAEPQRERAA